MFQCQRCGRCCREPMINICYSDIERWLQQKRFDILRKVAFVTFKASRQGFYFGDTVKQGHPPCPFLDETDLPTCQIYETRPKCCRDYPIASVSGKRCPSQPVVSRYEHDKVLQSQLRDFKKAYTNRAVLCKLLEIVYSFPDEKLLKKYEEVLK